MVRYVIRQQVSSVLRATQEVVFDSEFERPARLEFDRLVRDHPTEYFELVEVIKTETCLGFTRKPPG